MACPDCNLVKIRNDVTCGVDAFDRRALEFVDLETPGIACFGSEVYSEFGPYVAAKRRV